MLVLFLKKQSEVLSYVLRTPRFNYKVIPIEKPKVIFYSVFSSSATASSQVSHIGMLGS